ncbi:MAG: TonB-dependent receptor [Bacteroidetes bacterium]|nr:TonB-dependent receptor [Bacteroidota bacterium]
MLLCLLIFRHGYPQHEDEHKHGDGHVHGFVYEIGKSGEKKVLPGANVYWAGTTEGTATGKDGSFHLDRHEDETVPLVVSFIGFANDSVFVHDDQDFLEIELTMNNTLKEVVIANKAPGGFVSRLSPIQTFNITSAELQKAACCNLSESFQTNASVDVAYSDAVSGAKQIRLLGLAGKYSQIQMENIPNLRGLGTAYGLGFVPGPWMESIHVSKGTASVKNGYESITGQINIEYKKPDNSEKLYLNAYVNNHTKVEGNFNTAMKLNDHWSTMVLGHVENLSRKIDHDGDNFIDEPLVRQYHLFNRWKFDNHKNMHGQFGIKVLQENRQGGQVNYIDEEVRVPANGYGINIRTDRLEAFSKTAYLFKGRPGTNIAFINSFIYHFQESYFGLNDYNGRENNYYGNLMFQTYIGNTNHQITSGLSYMMDNYEEYLNDSIFSRRESVPGIFAEYTWTLPEQFTLLLGFRADFHNIFGTMLTPRMHLKYNPLKNTIIRASVGKGYRMPNVIAENTYILASSRKIHILDKPEMEEAWNYGLNLTQYIDILGRELAINLDYYRTYFINQVIIDRDFSPQDVLIYNLDGQSFSNSYQAEAQYELLEGLDITAAFRYNDVRMTINDNLMRQPFVNRYKGLITLSYATRMKKWQFDFTSQFNGDSRIPSTASNPEKYRMKDKSPAYTILNAQVTRYFKKWDIYIGGENLTGYRQKHPIIASDDPFGKYFDSSMIWGPVSGIKIYAGIRYSIK